MKQNNIKKIIGSIFNYYVVINMAISSLAATLLLAGIPVQVELVVLYLGITLWYVGFRKRLDEYAILTNFLAVAILMVAFTAFVIIGKGSIEGSLMVNMGFVAFPFFLQFLMITLVGSLSDFVLVVLGAVWLELILSILLQKRFDLLKKLTAFLLVMAVLAGVDVYYYTNRPEKKYAGHGFEYMNRYSSTDFSDYMVYSEPSKLAELDHPAAFQIENVKEMPVMDGAEACYPLYAAVAKAVYQDIAQIEKEAAEDDKPVNGEIVQFTNTVTGFERLLEGEVDLFFGARPSEDQMREAKDWYGNKKLEITPIGKEGFVFFVEADNPIEDLTSEQVKAIYHGDITNWSQVGGKNQEIVAFQRPRNSGSQTMMEYFMGDVELKEPMTYELYSSMMGVISHVAQYNDEAGAMGYSFRYFVEGLNQEQNVKILSIDGVKPTRENIQNGSYPLTTSLCLVTCEDSKNPNVQKMIDFMLSEDGQELVYQTGYGRLGDK